MNDAGITPEQAAWLERMSLLRASGHRGAAMYAYCCPEHLEVGGSRCPEWITQDDLFRAHGLPPSFADMFRRSTPADIRRAGVPV